VNISCTYIDISGILSSEEEGGRREGREGIKEMGKGKSFNPIS